MLLPLADHVARAGFHAGTPVAVARITDTGIDALAAGTWPDGRRVTLEDRFYGASLAKQVTAAAAALLVRDGVLDPDQPIGHWLADLPDWVQPVTPSELAHHIAGLPGAGELEAHINGHWTEAVAMGALHETTTWFTPGERYSYSNIGYVLLAKVVAAAAGMPFAEFVSTRLFEPHGLAGIGFTSAIAGFAHTAGLGPQLPLTQGDGGLWTTAPAFAHWLGLQNANAFHLAAIIEAPGELHDGTIIDYGWGVGLRLHRGYPLYIHGGEWPGAVAKAVRCPAYGTGIVALAAGAPFEAIDRLVASLLNES